MARFVSGKRSRAGMGWEELNYPSEPSVEAGAAPSRRGLAFQKPTGGGEVVVIQQCQVLQEEESPMWLGRALGHLHPGRRISTRGRGWNQEVPNR